MLGIREHDMQLRLAPSLKQDLADKPRFADRLVADEQNSRWHEDLASLVSCHDALALRMDVSSVRVGRSVLEAESLKFAGGGLGKLVHECYSPGVLVWGDRRFHMVLKSHCQ